MSAPQDQEAQLTLGLDLDDEKQRRLEAERERIQSSIAAAKFDTLQEKVAWLLSNFPETRNSDIALQIKYWERFDQDLFNGVSLNAEDLYELTRYPSLQRARAKIQNSHGLFQANAEVRRRRGKLSEEEKEKAVAQQPDSPVFSVYADESGKNQDYLVVGSVWFPLPGEMADVYLAIRRLKEQYGFKGELHFKEINPSKLPFYQALARFLGNTTTTFSFKSISVERRGIGRVDDALRTLFSFLLQEGVKHEVETGRADLPRKLQLIKDAEELGRDKLDLKWLQGEMATSARVLFENKLEIGDFRAESSEGSELLQVADLFTGSVSRLLNAKGDGNGPKDQFARCFLDAVNQHRTTREQGDAVYRLQL